MALNMSIVFKLQTIKDLGIFYEALRQAQTLQEKIKLDNEVKDLKRRKGILQSELNGLKQEINKLSPSEKLSELKDQGKEPEEETSAFEGDRGTLADDEVEMEQPEPQITEEEQTEGAFASDERFIVEEREEAVQEEERPTDV